jgi:hypothetical protein
MKMVSLRSKQILNSFHDESMVFRIRQVKTAQMRRNNGATVLGWPLPSGYGRDWSSRDHSPVCTGRMSYGGLRRPADVRSLLFL